MNPNPKEVKTKEGVWDLLMNAGTCINNTFKSNDLSQKKKQTQRQSFEMGVCVCEFVKQISGMNMKIIQYSC